MRAAYLQAFVDTASDHYQRYVATKRMFSDGSHYTGYLWDSLRNKIRVTYERFCLAVVRYDEVCVLADDHSRDLVITPPLWPFSPYSVIVLNPNELLQLLPALPEDIYVCDRLTSWTLVLTHEYDDRRRWCFGSPIDRVR